MTHNSSSILKVKYKAGDLIFKEGDKETHFYIIESGTVQIYTKSSAGKRIDLLQISDGESFGEFALLDSQPRSATAQAITAEVNLIQVSPEGFEELMRDLPVWAHCMLKSFVTRLKKTTKLLKDQDQFISGAKINK